jgi:ribonuclease HI
MNHIEIYADGGSRGNPGPSAIGAVLRDENGVLVACISEYIGETTNNVAEYRAVIEALKLASDYNVDSVSIRADSKLVVEQLCGRWKIKKPHLRDLCLEATILLAPYEHVDIQHVRRELNKDADLLVNAALDKQTML